MNKQVFCFGVVTSVIMALTQACSISSPIQPEAAAATMAVQLITENPRNQPILVQSVTNTPDPNVDTPAHSAVESIPLTRYAWPFITTLRTFSVETELRRFAWLQFSADSESLSIASIESDGISLATMDIESGDKLQSFLSYRQSRISSLALSPDWKLVAIGNQDGTIVLWDRVADQEITTLTRSRAAYVSTIAFSPDGLWLAAEMKEDINDVLVLWDINGSPKPKIRVVNDLVTIAFSPDSRLLATESWGDGIALWDTATLKQLRSFGETVTDLTPNGLVFSRDGTLLASTGYDDEGIVHLWDVDTGQTVQTLAGPSDYVTDVAFSPDSRLLVASSRDGTLRAWDVGHGTQIGKSQASGEAHQVAFAPDGTKIAWIADGLLQIWGLSEPEP